ncbi:hypothetical protein PVAND_017791 [Polypedilum vanderplanki]|uniref:Transposase domain-containing protein n=1 Tax=Polypedilum vanderplanki TaxID=319348 RepID=A0A9J6B9F7_POLVA|nr:hypothetical protein PVAND_017791 [Polypedilum vanderplanki]
MGRRKRYLVDLSRKGLVSRFKIKKEKLKVSKKNENEKPIKTNNQNEYLNENLEEYSEVDINKSEDNIEKADNKSESDDIKNLISINTHPKVTQYIKEQIQTITCKYNFSRIGVSEILKLLKDFFPDLPNDYRTLLSTPRNTIQRKVEPGYYVHLGLKSNLLNIFKHFNDNQILNFKDGVCLDFFIDGVAFFNISLNKSYWVILGKITNIKKTVFPIGIFNGPQKPNNFDNFLSEFVNELKDLQNDEVEILGKKYNIKCNNFLLDAPARADVCGTAHHSSYFSCPKCLIKGSYENDRLNFKGWSLEKRTDESFRKRMNPEFHRRTCLIEDTLKIDMVKSFPLDFLHVVLFGVVKKILKLLFGPKKPLLHLSCRIEINKKIEIINSTSPSEIHRRCRPLNEILTYKGNELRVFLLKLGPIVLHHCIPTDIYNNFMLLSIAFIILCNEELCITKNKVAHNMILTFLNEANDYYGSTFYSPMVHQLSHMAEEVLNQRKPCDEFSTFEFESYMTPLKHELHTSNEPLSQIHRRIYEKIMSPDAYNKLTEDKIKCTKSSNQEYESIYIDTFKFDTRSYRDRFVLTKKKTVKIILKIFKNDDISFLCRELKQCGEYFEIPIKATSLNFYWCKCQYVNEKEIISIKDIERKLFAMTVGDEMVFAPLQKLKK